MAEIGQSWYMPSQGRLGDSLTAHHWGFQKIQASDLHADVVDDGLIHAQIDVIGKKINGVVEASRTKI
jgi:hypothetical protein